MFFVNIPTSAAKVKLFWQLITGLFIFILSLILLLILDSQSLIIEQKIEYVTQVITAVASIFGLGIISYNVHYTRMLVKEIQENYSNCNNKSNISSTKLRMLEKLIENQDIQIEVSYTNLDDEKIPEDFYQAIEQLGSDRAEARLGAIYTLEQLASSSPSKQWTIIETLAAFIRENAPILKSDGSDKKSLKELVALPTDIEAALTVIARRDVSKEKKNQKLDLRYVNIAGADLSGANLRGADFTGSCLRDCILTQANLEGVDFSGVDMQSCVLYEANLTKALFYEANLQAALLPKAHLEEAVFYQANLRLATLYDANLTEAVFYQATLEGANLSDANLKLANLEACNICGANLIGANLTSANLIGANLQNTSLSTACLTEAVLYEANLSKANLYNANLTHANLVGANLTNTILQDADLSGADLSRVENLKQQQLELTQGNNNTTLPQHLTLPKTWV